MMDACVLQNGRTSNPDQRQAGYKQYGKQNVG
jgi:hypothetical protein